MAARQPTGKKPQHLWHTLRTLLTYMGRHKFLLLVVAVLVTISGLANLLGTYMIRPVVNTLADGDIRSYGYSLVGAAVLSGPSITGAPPWSPSSVMAAPCHLLPCGAKALAVPSGALRCRWRSPHPSWAYAHATFPQGKAFCFLPQEPVQGRI